MEHHSSYSAPRSSRGSEHTRPAASRPSRDAAASKERQQFQTYFTMLHTSIFSSQSGDLFYCHGYTEN